jgi:pyruvate,water dikinase
MAKILSIFDFFSKRRQEKVLRGEDERDLFVRSYRAFRELLNSNHRVLRIMGDMQEKAGGAYIFDRAYIRNSCREMLRDIERIIGQLNILADNRYSDLVLPYQACMQAIQNRLDPRISIPDTDFVLDLAELGQEDVAAAGGKFANLGELVRRMGVSVPPGFVITTRGYRAFMDSSRIEDFIRERFERLDIRDYDALRGATDEIQKKLLDAEIPPDLQERVMAAYEALCRQTGRRNLPVALRSSALLEDIRASFAGQFKTVLNVTAERIPHTYKSILASQFSPRAVFYYKQSGFNLDNIAMAVGVMAMVDSSVSGIAYTRDPEQPEEDRVMINAVCGLGPYAVGGIVPSDRYAVASDGRGEVLEREIGRQEVMLTAAPEGDVQERPVDRASQACLNDDQLQEITRLAGKLEAHFGSPQDIEWTIDENGRLFILQSRPLRLTPSTRPASKRRPASASGREVLLESGTVVCRGVAAGPVCVVRDEKDMAGFPQGAVLVVRQSHPEYAVLLERAAAVISDVGGSLGHLATVAREFKVPAVFNTRHASKRLQNGRIVTVDAVYGTVYDGRVEEVLRDKDTAFEYSDVGVVKLLQEIMEVVTPLNLTDPRAPEFTPRGCRTLHDITRFSHEKALQAMFDLTRESHFAERSAKQLVSEARLQWWVIDLEDGIEPGVKGKRVDIRQIRSIPMRALWEGMTAVAWAGPPPVDAQGFLSAMTRAASDASIEPAVGKRFADRNYILVARNFCNVSTRLGFHFSTLESFVSDKPDQNYISFVFTGGGADDGRKRRRAQLISRLLERYDFRVEIRHHTVFARLEGDPPARMQERLKIMGHIIVHTRQMDMVMYNDKMVDWYYKDQIRKIDSAFADPGSPR